MLASHYIREEFMITGLDHLGIVAPDLSTASDVLLGQFGFDYDVERTALPDGNVFAPENTSIWFVKVGTGATRIEILVPRDDISGIARFLSKNGPGLHHIGYSSTSVPDDMKKLVEAGLDFIDFGTPTDELTAAFFHPKTAAGILHEIVPDRGVHG